MGLLRKGKNLQPLLNPRSVAVVGASEKFGAGSLVIENLRTLGYEGKIIPINPGYETVLGLACYPSLLDVPNDLEIDAVAIALGSHQVIPVLEQAGKRRIQGAWAFASGFAEAGEEGRRLQEQLRKICMDYDIRFIGPNCVGFANLHGRVGMYSAPISPTLKKGAVGVIAQSGSVVLVLANSNRGVGFSTLVSSGNEAVLDTTDYLAHLVEDEHTAVIIAFLEAIRRPDAFMEVCERASDLGKPIITLKVGRSGLAEKAALTHTGALTGSDRVHDVLFRKLGVIRVNDLDQLLETAETFVRCRHRLPAGGRAGAITVSGGEIGLIGDLSEGFSISFPSFSKEAYEELHRRLPPYTAVGNPLDGWGKGDLTETYPACLEVLAKEEEIDLVIVSQDSPPGMAEKQVSQYADVARAAVRATSFGKPVVAFSHVSGGLDQTIKGILDQGDVPFLQGTRESLLAIHHLIEYGRFQKNRKGGREVGGRSPKNLPCLIQKMKGDRRLVPETLAKEVLRAYGIPVVGEAIVKSVDHAVKAGRRLGYPLAVKGISSQISHKTEAGLVRLNVRNERELRGSCREILESAKSRKPEAVVEGILIQKMVSSDGVEVILGISRDASFGPVVVFGLGGIWVELLADTAVRLPPVGQQDAREMISELKGKKILEGFRGRKPADLGALVEALVQVGQMALDLRDVLVSLDLNPLIVLPGKRGVRVVDVVMEVEGAG